MKRMIAMLLVMVLCAPMAGFTQNLGSLAGTAQDANNAIMSGVKVQLRNADTGQLVNTTTSGANGGFSFAGLPPGNYVVEIVNAAGQIVGASASIAVAAGATITGITVAASAAGAAAAAAAGGFAAFFGSTAGILTGIAVVGGIAAGVVIAGNASASR
ncbi:MAG: carboxypeptidase regulatory-like domain-containing protein [Vicinamibacterales bacterium]|nr:carboxypeptidase regulatory-like domain-containing protein [Vicinamibacterales bacterium]